MWVCPTCRHRCPAATAFCPNDGDLMVNEGATGLLTGQRLADRFLLRNMLGEGGMGQVYEAWDRQSDEVVAVKLIKGSAEPEQLDRSSRRLDIEAQAMTRIDHPGIARVHDLYRTDDGSCFLVMERLRGPSFDLIFRTSSVDSDRRFCWMREICKVMACCHQSGVAHRDLKPSNLLLHRADDGAAQVKVLDFGLAKLVDVSLQGVTRTGEVLGTFAYMSPEQIRGEANIGPASDVYSLAVIIFEMLAGKRPFSGLNGIDFLRLHTTKPAPFLSKYIPQVSPELERIVQRCLSKAADRRFPTAFELAEALESTPCLSLRTEQRASESVRIIEVSRSWAGKVLNERYEIEEWLAPGRLGSSVYRARDMRTERTVAVRLWDVAQRLESGAPDIGETLLDLVRREAKTLQIRHPGLIAVFDLDYTDDCVYIVTELVGGVSLKEYLQQQRPLSRAEALRLVQGAAETTALLHQKDIVTGGLSLETVRVVTSTTDGLPQLLLSPFGLGKLNEIARIVWRDASRPETDLCISPEQDEGRTPDKRSDVYVLGKILADMLSGARSPSDQGDATVSLSTVSQPNSTVDFVAKPDGGWERFLGRALSPDPAQRYCDAVEFLEALAVLAE